MQPYQIISNLAHLLMQALDSLGEGLVLRNQWRQLQTKEGNAMPLGAQNHPACYRHKDHEGIQRQMHRCRQESR